MFEVSNTPEILQLMSDLQQHQSEDPALGTQRVWAQYNLTNKTLDGSRPADY
jgi:hypothetical protein